MKSLDNLLVGQSGPMREIKRLIELAAPSTTTLLVQGETGTGKELVAQAIHALSGRKGQLISVNCSAIPSELLESELFGHEKGAFTGADKLRAGRFELADGGTLFLDEIGDMPLPLQAKLLRALKAEPFSGSGAQRKLKLISALFVQPIRISRQILKLANFGLTYSIALMSFHYPCPPWPRAR